MNYTVYMHIAPNGKRYIGITCQKPSLRWGNGSNYRPNRHFYNAIKKYGWNNIKHIILYSNVSKEFACQKEMELIKQYNTNDINYGYNNSIGGESTALGYRHTKEEIDKIRKHRIGYITPIETRDKISNTLKGRKFTEERINNIRKGVEHTRKRVVQIDAKTNKAINVFDSLTSAAEATKIKVSYISNCCRHKKHCKTAGGYIWIFKNNTD